MDKQQTAVEWLIDELTEPQTQFLFLSYKPEMYELIKIINQAKEMHKQQILDAYETGIWDVGCRAADSEQYYQETFKK